MADNMVVEFTGQRRAGRIEIDPGVTISMLVDKLMKIKEEHGDLRVVCHSDDSVHDPDAEVGRYEYSPAAGIGVSYDCVWL